MVEMSGTSSCCQVMLLALTADSSDHEECNSSSYLSLWHSRIHNERCSANGWRQMARKERRHLSVKMTREETVGIPTPQNLLPCTTSPYLGMPCLGQE